MILRTPEFWYRRRGGLKSCALMPFALVYRMAARVSKAAARPARSPVPVICVGNLTAGGSGKTPAAIMVMEIVKETALARNPVFLTRGYGRTAPSKDSFTVDPAIHSAADCGDEALLLAKHAPVIVDSNRVRGAAHAAGIGSDLIIMDDGLQNPNIKKDVAVIVIDGGTGFGNARLIPAGPLREPLHNGLGKADMFIIVGEDSVDVRDLLPGGVPVVGASVIPADGFEIKSGEKYIAFTGIAHPQKFFNTLEKAGADIVSRHEYPDHYSFRQSDIERLYSQAAAKGAGLITTEKDLMRLKNLPLPYLPECLPVTMTCEGKDMEKIKEVLRGKAGTRPLPEGK